MTVRDSFTRWTWVTLVLALSAATRAGAQSPPPPLEQVLARVTAAARVGDPGLRALHAALDAATSRHAAAGFTAPAALSAGFSDGPRGDLLAGNAALEIGREVFRGRLNAADRARESVEVDAARAEVAAAERRLDLRVEVALARAAGAARNATRLDRSDRWLGDAEASLRARFAVGEARYVDVLRVRTERLQASAERSRMLADLAAATESLAALVGDALGRDSLVALVAAASVDAATVAWRDVLTDAPTEEEVIALFPSVRAAEAEGGRARAMRGLTVAASRPQFAASVGVQRICEANGGPTAGLLLGVSGTLPFTALTAQRRGLTAADAEIAAAQATLFSARALARAQVRAAQARYAAARERLDTFDAALLLAADAEREAALSEYRGGNLTLVELLDFERALLRVEVERTRALIEAVESRGALYGIDTPDTGAGS